MTNVSVDEFRDKGINAYFFISAGRANRTALYYPGTFAVRH